MRPSRKPVFCVLKTETRGQVNVFHVLRAMLLESASTTQIRRQYGPSLAPVRSQAPSRAFLPRQEGKWDRRTYVTIRHIGINQKGRILVRVQLDKTGIGDMRPMGVALRGRADPLHPGPLTRVGYATCLRGFTVKSTNYVTNRHIDRIRVTQQ